MMVFKITFKITQWCTAGSSEKKKFPAFSLPETVTADLHGPTSSSGIRSCHSLSSDVCM